MPNYQFICLKCNTEFEKKVDYNDSLIVDCPQCNSRAKKKFSPVPVIFKGSGFYCTDNPKTNS